MSNSLNTHIPIIEELSNQIENDENWEKSVEIMEESLLEGTAEYFQLLEIKDDYDMLPLTAAYNGYIDIIQFLLRNKLPINRKFGGYDYTMLHAAAAHGHYALSYLLIQHGANIHERNSFGNTSLHKAAQYGRLKIVKLLVDLGADCNSQNYDGSTPLFSAIKHERVIEYLVDSGCNTQIKDNNGKKFYHLLPKSKSRKKKKGKSLVDKVKQMGKMFIMGGVEKAANYTKEKIKNWGHKP